jgi:hypothetical protein
MSDIDQFAGHLQDAFDPTSPEEIARFERELGVPLPADYVRFLSVRNGGRLRDDLLCGLRKPSEYVDTCRPTLFYSLDPQDGRNLRAMRAEFPNRVPQWFLPIADSNNNNDVVGIRLSGKQSGAVFLWAASEDTMHLASRGANLYLVADSFSEFLTLLKLPADRDANLIETQLLFRAVETSDLESIRDYLDGGGDLEALNGDGRTMLGVAASWARTDVIPLLLERGAQLEVRDKRGHTPLRMAVESSSVDGVKLLLAAGARIDSLDNQGVGMLDVARKYYQARIISLLESKKHDR